MVTIKDVAKKADVSIATVSNYLNRTKPVSKELGARIQNAVDELGYWLFSQSECKDFEDCTIYGYWCDLTEFK